MTIGFRQLRLASLAAVAVAAVATGAAGAAQAAPGEKFKEPKLRHGVLKIDGTHESDAIALRLRTGDPSILDVDVDADGVGDFSFARDEITAIRVHGKAGDDRISLEETNGIFTVGIAATIDGGEGNDRLLGGAGSETLDGGDGADVVDGNGGKDTAFLGDGDDVFVWDPGDGSDTIDGEAGLDTMLFNGAGGPEQVDLSANGNRLRFFRTQGAVTMDTTGVERVEFNALGGADTITVNDLTGTDVDDVSLDLGAADGQTDQVVVNATDGNDDITVGGDAANVTASGLAATVAMLDAEAGDQLRINTLLGTDTVHFAALAANAIKLFVDGLLVN